MTALAETIAGQAEVLSEVLGLDVDDALWRLERARRLWLVGTGTSQHAAELGAWMLGGGDKEVHARSCAAFAYSERPLRGEDAVALISHRDRVCPARAPTRFAVARQPGDDHRPGQGLARGGADRHRRALRDLHRQLPGRLAAVLELGDSFDEMPQRSPKSV